MTKLSIPHEFVQRTVLPNKHLTAASNTESLRRIESTSSLDSAQRTGIDITKSCDFVFWAGDMNFRINMSHQEVLDYCEKLNYNDILFKDEFRVLQKQTGKEKKTTKFKI
jgi:hypothetical protein